MPNSSNVFNATLIEIFKRISPKTVYDVGVGSGKYGALLKAAGSEVILTGCEIDEIYLTEYKDQHSFYKNIVNKSVIEVIETEEVDTDLVIFGDVLEHLKYSQVFDVLDYFQYRSKFMLCVYPSQLPQKQWEGHWSERHVSEIRLGDIVNKYEIIEYKKAWDELFFMNLLLLKGYL